MDFKRYPDGAVFNGDCLPLMKQVQPESIDLILTDPPYGVNFKNEFYDDSKESVLGAMPEWFFEWYRILKDDSYLMLYVGVKTLHHWISAGIKTGFNFKISSAFKYMSGLGLPAIL